MAFLVEEVRKKSRDQNSSIFSNSPRLTLSKGSHLEPHSLGRLLRRRTTVCRGTLTPYNINRRKVGCHRLLCSVLIAKQWMDADTNFFENVPDSEIIHQLGVSLFQSRNGSSGSISPASQISKPYWKTSNQTWNCANWIRLSGLLYSILGYF